ncbi:MAG: aldose 1-epimerase [Flavobacteriaceae bacterium]
MKKLKTTLKNSEQEVIIEDGELIGYQVAGHQFIHQKGSPGWRNSDIEMFPIIGPTAEAGYRVQVSRANAIQDQHGLLRELDYELVSHDESSALFQKTYDSGTVITNSKYPEKSTARFLIWPFNFQFKKAFNLTENGLEITFTVSGERDMPFMLGYHPAFRLSTDLPSLTVSDKTITLQEVLDVGNRALEIPNCNTIVLQDEKELMIRTEGFRHFMLWTEVQNMICIEPITFYPYALPASKLHEGFDYLEGTEQEFKVWISPG